MSPAVLMRQLFDPLAGARRLPETSLRSLRAAQLGAVLRLTPVLMAANIGLAAVVVGTLGRTAWMLWVWAAAVTAIALLGLRGWRRSRRRAPLSGASARALAVLTRQALLLGGVWAALPPLLMHDGSLEAAALSIALVASSLSCGSFALVSVPGAALAYALPMAASICVCMGVSAHPILRVMAVLEVFFIALLEGLMVSQSRQFGARLVSELKLQGQHDLLKHLLAEIEADPTAWRWRTDPEGRLDEVSDAALAGGPGGGALGGAFASLMTPADAAATSPGDLAQALARRTPFDDLQVSHLSEGRTRWWSLSGKPVFDEFGGFTGFRGVGRDVTDQHAAEERIRYMARHDGLTGLANRMAFGETLAGLGPGTSAAVLALDLDRFKAVNDTLGHPAGDALLVQVALRLQAALPPGAVAARLGGDEFAALVVGGASPGELVAVTDRLIAAVAEPYDLGGQAASVGVSVGVATQIDAVSGPEALQRADLALYQAKLDGRGAARFFEAHMAEEAHRQHALEADLRAALAKGEFEVHYQPLIDSRTHEVTAFEALLRWERPGFGLLSPAVFIEKCEQCGLIAQVGAWVLQVATREAATWPAAIRVAVNLSAVQFASGELAASVQAALDASGLAADRLELEITESVLITDQAGVLEQLRALKRIGVRIALDDFGTGYSSLAYLWRFPFDKLKIDRSFIADLHAEGPVVDIVRTIAALGRTLNLSITAEGVETPEQAAALEGLACGELQGFHFSRPMPAGELAAYLLRHHLERRRREGAPDGSGVARLRTGG